MIGNTPFLADEDVVKHLKIAATLYDENDIFPIDTGSVLYRNVMEGKQKDKFIEWFIKNVVKVTKSEESLNNESRVFAISGRAGQGKSTLIRHMYLAIKGQWNEDLRTRPNFTIQNDDLLSNFFTTFQALTRYAQARTLPEHSELVKVTQRMLIFIDGIDEATEQQLVFLAQLIKKYENSVFIITSRSRAEKGEDDHVIHWNDLTKEMQNIGLPNTTVHDGSVQLSNMSHKEKLNMLDLLKRFEEDKEYTMLETLAENNSALLQRPADFLVFRAKDPKTKAEYYIEHLRWLLLREMRKDEKRSDLVKKLKFPDLLSNKITYVPSRNILKIETPTSGLEINYMDTMVLFNLIEKHGLGENADYYLDLSTPASRGILLIQCGGYDAKDLEREDSVDANLCVQGFVSNKEKKMFEEFHRQVINPSEQSNKPDHPSMHQILASLISGYAENHEVVIKEVSAANLKKEQTGNRHENFKLCINQALWLADVCHPVDELKSEINVEPHAQLLRDSLEAVYEMQKIHTHCQHKVEHEEVGHSDSDSEEESPRETPHLVHCSTPFNKAMTWRRTDNEEQRCYACKTDLPLIGKDWFNHYSPLYETLILRIAQIGPYVTEESYKEPVDYLGKTREIPLSFEHKIFWLYRTMLNRYAVEIKNRSFSMFLKVWNPIPLPHPSNQSAKRRTFLFICSVLGISDIPKNNDRSSFGTFRMIKSKLAEWLLPFSTPFTTEFIDSMLTFNFKDISLKLFFMMGQKSMNSEKIVRYYVDDGIDPLLTYHDPSQNLKALVDKELSKTHYHADNLLRSSKFIGAVTESTQNPFLVSVLHGMIIMSRMGHMQAIDSWGNYTTTIDADTGRSRYMAANHPEDQRGRKWVEYVHDFQRSHFPLLPDSIPPAFHQHLRNQGYGDNKEKERIPIKIKLDEFLESEGFPATSVKKLENDSVQGFRDRLVARLKSTLDEKAYVELYASVHSHFAPSQKKSLSEDRRLEQGLLQYLEHGEFFSATLLSLRTPFPHISSLLISTESVSDDFFDIKNQILGNYLYRRLFDKYTQVATIPNKRYELEPFKIINGKAKPLNRFIKECLERNQPKSWAKLASKYKEQWGAADAAYKLINRKSITLTRFIEERQKSTWDELEPEDKGKWEKAKSSIQKETAFKFPTPYDVLYLECVGLKQSAFELENPGQLTDESKKKIKKSILQSKLWGLEADGKLLDSEASRRKERIRYRQQISNWRKKNDSMVLKIELDSNMHQDSNLSIYKQRRYRIKILNNASEVDSTQLWSDPDCVEESEWPSMVNSESRGLFYDRNDLFGLQLDSAYYIFNMQMINRPFEPLPKKEKFLDELKKPPQRVADVMQHGDDGNLNAWHTMPYFATPISNAINGKLNFKSQSHEIRTITDVDEHAFLFHLAQDSILGGANFDLDGWGKVRTKFNKQNKIKNHHSVGNISKSAGLIDLNYGLVEKKDKIYCEHVCSDANLFPSGLRTIYTGQEKVSRRLTTPLKSEVPKKGDVEFNFESTKMSSIRFAHRKPRVPGTEHALPAWVEFPKGAITWSFFNEVYGHKIGFNSVDSPGPSRKGLCEYSQTKSTSSTNLQVNAFVEVDDQQYSSNPLFAHSSWQQGLEETKTINETFAKKLDDATNEGGRRQDRVFGFITDTGKVDRYVLDRIHNRLAMFEQNAQQLKNQQRVISGRANMMNLLRDISTYFRYSEWLPSYLEAYQEIRGRFESILDQIQAIELEQMGESLPGTEGDFRVVRAMLQGIEYIALQHREDVRNEYQSILESSEGVNFGDLMKRIRALDVHLLKVQLDVLYHSLIDKNVCADSEQRAKLRIRCRPNQRLEIRVLGLNQIQHPYTIRTSWNEVVGTLAHDNISNEVAVGSLVRLDLKRLDRAGNSKALVANICYASDELSEEGSILEQYTPSAGEDQVNWPSPLPQSTWLKIGTDFEDNKTEMQVKMYIKREKRYAFHPSLEVEIPILNPDKVPKNRTGELRTCTIDIRRDRLRGLFRYYVTKVE
jgi:hypothetical protein